jgi:hypothetical protein
MNLESVPTDSKSVPIDRYISKAFPHTTKHQNCSHRQTILITIPADRPISKVFPQTNPHSITTDGNKSKYFPQMSNIESVSTYIKISKGFLQIDKY